MEATSKQETYVFRKSRYLPSPQYLKDFLPLHSISINLILYWSLKLGFLESQSNTSLLFFLLVLLL